MIPVNDWPTAKSSNTSCLTLPVQKVCLPASQDMLAFTSMSRMSVFVQNYLGLQYPRTTYRAGSSVPEGKFPEAAFFHGIHSSQCLPSGLSRRVVLHPGD